MDLLGLGLAIAVASTLHYYRNTNLSGVEAREGAKGVQY
jgi:hypothetical protein